MANNVIVILENIRSAYNVGSIFRTCDAAGVSKLYLTGYTAIPPEPKLHKTALGAVESVAWEHHCSTPLLIKLLKSQNVTLLACEPLKNAKNIYRFAIQSPTALIFGNEVKGISQEVLSLCDQVVKIPQLGAKSSLNVASAAAALIFESYRQLNQT